MHDLFEEVDRVLSTSRREYERRVDSQIEFLIEEYETGVLHNPEPTIGLELELYCVDEQGRLARIPRDLLEEVGIAHELGLHNAEVNTQYTVLDEDGFREKRQELEERLREAEETFSREGLRLVSDGMCVIPPEEGSYSYLEATEEREGVIVAKNAAFLPRYHTISNIVREKSGGKIRLKVPGFDREFDTILPEALTTSIQPHHQVPDPAEFVDYFNYSIRLLGPILALATNSPFLPYDLYDRDAHPEDVAYHELRIQVFEQMINVDDDYSECKVRVPDDLESIGDVFEEIRGDETIVPILAEEGTDRYEDRFFEFNMKRGTFWRWTRPVVGGETRDEANLRMEFRPLPSQPTLRGTVGLQALFSGALLGLFAEEHPLLRQDWDVAKENFYAAAEDGLEAELRWIDRHGDEITSMEEMYNDLFNLAETGLRQRHVSKEFCGELLDPLKRRAEEGVTPSVWKVRKAAKHFEESGDLHDALRRTQEEYLGHQENCLLEGDFTDYPWQDI